MRKQTTPYLVRDVRLSSGERLPVICSRSTGVPLFEPTLYAVTELRARNRSTSTIHQALRAIMVLELIFDRHGIDLTQRLRECQLLDMGEVDEVARSCRLPIESLSTDRRSDNHARWNVTSIEKVRMRGPTVREVEASVSSDSASIRMLYILGYLRWRVTYRLLQLGGDTARRSLLKSNSEAALTALKERTPGASHRSADEQREGLSPEQLDRLVDTIQPNSPDNPWVGEFARQRNHLMLMWVLALGLRRGELLGVRISDISFQRNEVFIARRPDDPEDPRTSQPRAKTRSRLIPLADRLADATRAYILGARRSLPNARKHPFLFVATGTGAPLSLSAVTKIFEALRTRCDWLPDGFVGHLLRHTHAEFITAAMEAKGVSSEVEERVRSRLMGWADGSRMATVYTRRHVRKKADEVSLDLQSQLLEPKPK
jgi:integrase